MSTKIHATAAAALADNALGAKMLSSLEEARKLTGQPAKNVNGLPGYYASPMRCVGGVVCGVTMTKQQADTRMELTRDQLNTSLRTLIARCHSQTGSSIAELHYSDKHDTFRLIVQGTNVGVSVRGFVNNSAAYQLNGRFWSDATTIGEVMLLASGAPAGATVDSFFVN